jgi:putative ABC transport system permease protein
LAFVVLTIAGLSAAAEPDEQPVLFSRQLLEAEGLSTGDIVRLSTDRGGRNARPFRIVGAYEPAPDPMKLTVTRHEARLHLADLIELGGGSNDPPSVDAINVLLREPERATAHARRVVARTPGLVAYPTTGGDGAAPFVVLERFHLAIAWITVFGSTAFLLALMVMRADERRETIGVLRLIGFSRGRVVVEVLLEGMLVATGGALFGVVLAVLAQDAFNGFFRWYYDTTLTFVRVTPGLALRCVALSVPMGVLASVVASWRLLRREVMGLLRR